MLHRVTISKNSTRTMQNVELWVSSLLEYAQEGHHNLVLPSCIQLCLLKNQVGDILPKLSLKDKKSMEEGSIATVADLTNCDSQGRH